MAVNCTGLPLATEGLGGVTAMDCRVAAVTVRTVEPVIPESAAETVEVPAVTPVARPFDPAALEMVATEVVAEAQVTCVVRFCVEVSE